MALTILAILFSILIVLVFEFRIRRPDQIVLTEKQGTIHSRTGHFYPRHFSLAINGSVHSREVKMVAEAKGYLPVNIKIAIDAAASKTDFDALIRVGGWQKATIDIALEKAKVLLLGYVKEYCASREIEDLDAQNLTNFLEKAFFSAVSNLGLTITSLTVQQIEPADKEIIIALQKEEEARLAESTEQKKQKVRLNLAQNKAEADHQIAELEHKLDLKKLELKKAIENTEAELAQKRVQDELQLKNLQFEYEKKEMELFNKHPELLMLSPQLARLAEASQQMPNAKTVVSFNPGESANGSKIVETIEGVLETIFNNRQNRKQDKKSVKS